MSQANPLEQAGSPPFIEQVVGPDKGRTVTLSGEKMTIGRADGNDIVVQSDGVSRLHAYLMQSEGQWYIRDNGSKNGILVNGQRVTESWLQSGDVVQVGNFVFRYSDPGALAAAAEPQIPMETPMMSMGMESTGVVDMPKKKPNRRVLLYIVVLGGLAYFYTQQNAPEGGSARTTADAGAQGSDLAVTKEEIAQLDGTIGGLVAKGNGLSTDERLQLKDLQDRKSLLEKQLGKSSREFESARQPDALFPSTKPPVIGLEDPELKEAEKFMEKLDWSNSSLREAEQFFRKGQREYLNGSYQRAIDSFQTALSFYSGHKLAANYLRRTYYEVEGEARKHMDMGVQYFESLQFQRALHHFTEVTSLMAHRPTENMVSQAEKYSGLCRRRLQAAELFP